MIKTELRPIKIFDMEAIKVGDKIKYGYFYPNRYVGEDYPNEVCDGGYGEVLSVSEHRLGIDYDSEFDLDFNYATGKYEKSYRQIGLSVDDIESGIHKIEILEQ